MFKGLKPMKPFGGGRVINNILGSGYKKNDWDLDGVKNRKDCQPRNPMRQDKIKIDYEGYIDGPKRIGANVMIRPFIGSGTGQGEYVKILSIKNNILKVQSLEGEPSDIFYAKILGKWQ